MTGALLDAVLESQLRPDQLAHFKANFGSTWPLEALLDELELLGFNVWESMLQCFAEQDAVAQPNPLHDAIVRYYKGGHCSIGTCYTTNWDGLLERAFRSAGISATCVGPGGDMRIGGSDCDPTSEVVVYHAHGSFEMQDVVCSFMQEQRQLNLRMDFHNHATAFLGYSGYEPSLYGHLQSSGQPQLWCILSEDDLAIPSKRRLLCRPNVVVYVGDVRDLLSRLGLLSETVSFAGPEVQPPELPPRLAGVASSALLSLNVPEAAAQFLLGVFLDQFDEPEASFRFVSSMRGLVRAIQNRTFIPQLMPALLGAANFRNSEQLWVSALACVLRGTPDVGSRAIARMLNMADQAKAREAEQESAAGLFVSPGVALVRRRVYESFARRTGQLEKINYIYPPLVGADMASSGEFLEVLAFEYLRSGDAEAASRCFDSAATAFFLTGLARAGQAAEWAATHIDELEWTRSRTTLFLSSESA